MSRVLTGDKLVDSIRTRAMIPNDTSVFTDEMLLEIANEEIDVQLLDKLLSIHEEHITVHVEIPRNDKGEYEIPYRAVGSKVRDVTMIFGSENLYEMTQISIGELSDYTFNTDAQSEGRSKFYIEHNKIKLVQPERGYDKIRFYFHIRPNVLTKVDRAGIIRSINKDQTNDEVTFTFTNIPNDFSTNNLFDFVGYRTPNKIKAYDIQALEVDSSLSTVKFRLSELTEFIDEILVNDYLCKAEESPVPNFPTEMHPYLAQLTAVHVLESMNDTEGLANARNKLESMRKAVMQLVDNRVELSPKKIKPRNGVLSEGRSGYYKRRGR